MNKAPIYGEISAKDARQMFEDSFQSDLVEIFNSIREFSQTGHNNLELNKDDYSTERLEQIKKYLEKLGYEVNWTLSEGFIIEW